MTSAGMVSGSRQRNSTIRAAPGTRSRTQIIVGTSSTTMPTTVSRASSSDVVIASVIVGSSARARQASPVRSPVAGIVVLKSSSARSGSTKYAAKTSSSSQRSTRHVRAPGHDSHLDVRLSSQA